MSFAIKVNRVKVMCGNNVICKMQYITAYLCTNEGDDALEECC